MVAQTSKRALEGQIAELEVMLKDTNEAAARVGQSAVSRLKTRIRDLELELGSCQSKTGEATKAYQKAERRIKELQFQEEEDKKNQVWTFFLSVFVF